MKQGEVRFVGYEASRSRPNIVVDGAANDATVLTLTHWPGAAQPLFVSADLSAAMVFRFLDLFQDDPGADVVTNNHFDQDGLVSVHAFVEPEQSLEHRDLLIDVASAGDFATFRDRRAARASMTISRFAERAMSDGQSASTSDSLYTETLPLLLSMVLDSERFRDDWSEEDAELEACERLVAGGIVTIEEREELDLAIVKIPEKLKPQGGHRFGGLRVDGLHPMAINNATDRFRLLTAHGRRYRYTDRYETWVQYRSRRPLPRVDLRLVAEDFTSRERNGAVWRADGPGTLIPELAHTGESSLELDEIVAVLSRHLRTQTPAWDPYDTTAGRS